MKTIECQSYDFLNSVKDLQCFNVPSGVKQLWKNKFATGYLFPDDSYLVFNTNVKDKSLFWASGCAFDSRNGFGLLSSMFLTSETLKERNRLIAERKKL